MGKRQDLRKKRAEQEKRKNILILIGVLGIALIIGGVIIYDALKPIGEILPPPERSHPQAAGMAMGNPNASIVVEEFSDFQCVWCSRFWESNEEAFIKDYVETGLVYFKYTPFNIIGSESIDAAEAAYCANEQGKFWEYHDILFANWNGENTGNFNKDRLIAFADTIGLERNQFEQCFNQNKYTDEMNQAMRNGQQLGVTGTPSFSVNGTIVSSNELLATIDELLK